MRKKIDMIFTAEASFARVVALGVIVNKPLSIWHSIIPGMFIFDFLKRTKAIKEYSKHFLFPRKLALDGVQDIMKGEDEKNTLLRIDEEINAWLNALKRYSPKLHHELMEVVKLLMDHYSKLLCSEGSSHDLLINNAYKNRDDYKVFLEQLNSVEKEVDRALTEISGETENLRERLLEEQTQVEKQRKKSIDDIFPA